MDFEEQSFKNMVWFYRYELRQIDNGVNADQIFSDRRLKILKKYGILIRKYRDPTQKIFVTPEAQRLIQEVKV